MQLVAKQIIIASVFKSIFLSAFGLGAPNSIAAQEVYSFFGISTNYIAISSTSSSPLDQQCRQVEPVWTYLPDNN